MVCVCKMEMKGLADVPAELAGRLYSQLVVGSTTVMVT